MMFTVFQKKVAACVAILALSASLVGCHGPQEWREAKGVAWGTTYNIKYYASADLADSVVAEMRRVELSLSPFDAESTVSRINRGETDSLDAMTATVFRASQRINALSDGAFDPTVAPLVNLWGFGYRDDTDGGNRPDSVALADALARVGIADCVLDNANVLHRKHPRTELDFSAIAKGYGVDCVADMLRRNECERYMVEIGGEVSVSGLSPRNADWRIQIDSPLSDSVNHRPLGLLPLHNQAVATSGNYRNYRRLPDGTVVSHTISPQSGMPVRSNVLSVTVVAPLCVEADALATACMAMPLDSAKAMIEKEPEVSALFAVWSDTLSVITVGPAFSSFRRTD